LQKVLSAIQFSPQAVAISDKSAEGVEEDYQQPARFAGVYTVPLIVPTASLAFRAMSKHSFTRRSAIARWATIIARRCMALTMAWTAEQISPVRDTRRAIKPRGLATACEKAARQSEISLAGGFEFG
jgi:hypothetical protein